jgi:N-acetyl-anhydromuramyl-L-alanine amidase AmpD
MMRRRDFIRKLAEGAAAASPIIILGCQGGSGLLREPAPPIFEARRSGGLPPLEPPSAPPAAPPAPVRPTGPSDWQPRAGERPWQFIVLHHSATATGSAAEFDRIHRARGWDELGYHFVIGNGRGAPDGLIEIGTRWVKQKHGAHCKVENHPEYNDYGVGVCLVGNFDETRPTEAQVASAARVVRFLMARYRVPAGRIYGHNQLKPTTRCPGRYFPYNDIFRRLA